MRMDNNVVLSFMGVDMGVDVYSNRVEIKPKKSLMGFLTAQGGETILFKNISSVEVRECSFVNAGHLQISASGTSSKENKIVFGGFGDRKTMNETANKIKQFIISEISKPEPTAVSTVSTSDELLKLVKLKEDGILTEAEFTQAKSKLLTL